MIHGVAPAALAIVVGLSSLHTVHAQVGGAPPADAMMNAPPPMQTEYPPGPQDAASLPAASLDSEGPAASDAIPTRNLLQIIRDGGPLMIPIGVCSFILCVFVFERAISLRRGRVIPRPFVKRFLEQLREGQLERDEALELCEQNRSPVAEVFAGAVKKWGRSSVEVEQAIIDSGERVSNDLRRYIRMFNGISTLCPLLGLLGTVLGMIEAFNTIAVADAMGRPEMLAGGIGQALITTAAGLTVAIPALIAYLFFVSRVDRLIMDIDAAGQELVGLISGDSWRKDNAGSRGKPKAKPAA